MSRGMPSIFDPLRALDWRYRRALELQENHRPASVRRDDQTTLELLGCLRSLRRSARGREQAALDFRDSSIAMAIELYAGADSLRSVVEAWLLTLASPPDISERSGVPAAAIESYHACFFDVRDRLSRPDFILHAAVLPCAMRSAAARPMEAVLKLAAYLGGPGVLLEILAAPRRGAECLADLIPGIDRANDGLIALTRHVALLAQPTVGDQAAREGLLQRVRRQAATLPPEENLTEYQREIQKILLAAGAAMKPAKRLDEMSPAERPYYTSSIELRAHEMMRTYQTGIPPDPELLSRKFPDPPAREADAAAGGNR